MPLPSFDQALVTGDVATVSRLLDTAALHRRIEGESALTRAWRTLAHSDPQDKGPLRILRLLLREGVLDTPPGAPGHLVELARVAVPPSGQVALRQGLRELRQAEADLNAPTREGTTPLLAALAAGNAPWATLLIEAGADPVSLRQGRTPLEQLDAHPTPGADLRVLRAHLAEQTALATLRQARGQAPRRRSP